MRASGGEAACAPADFGSMGAASKVCGLSVPLSLRSLFARANIHGAAHSFRHTMVLPGCWPWELILLPYKSCCVCVPVATAQRCSMRFVSILPPLERSFSERVCVLVQSAALPFQRASTNFAAAGGQHTPLVLMPHPLPPSERARSLLSSMLCSISTTGLLRFDWVLAF